MLTKVTNIVLDDNIEINTLNGCEISLFAKPNSIPKAGLSGVLDPSWGTGGGGSGGSGGSGDMSKIIYDTNSDGKVDFAEKADKITSEPTNKNQIWGVDENKLQRWLNIVEIALPISYDTNKDGKVNAADSADTLAGSPGPNRLWGTNVSGIQMWLAMANGDMARSIYDTNADGIVNAADSATKLSGNPVGNHVWGTDNIGIQTWLPLNLSTIMFKSAYDPMGYGNKVIGAVYADKLSSEAAALPGTVYYKNIDGTVSWEDINILSESAMSIYVYDPDKDGKVTSAEYADKLSIDASSIYPSIYAKTSASTASFISLSTLEPNLMLKNVYDKNGDGIVDFCSASDKLSGIDNVTVGANNLGFMYGKYNIVNNGVTTTYTGFATIHAFVDTLVYTNRYSSIYNKYENINIDNPTTPINDRFLGAASWNSIDISVYTALLRTDIYETKPKKGYIYTLTAETLVIDTQIKEFDGTTTPNSISIVKPIWSGWNGLHGVKTRLAGNISIIQNSETIINWGKTVHNSEDMWVASSPTKLTIPANHPAPIEWCRLSFNIKFLESSSSIGKRTIIIKKNNIMLDDFPLVSVNKYDNSMTSVHSCSGPLNIKPDDYFTLHIMHDNNGTLSIDSLSSYFALELI